MLNVIDFVVPTSGLFRRLLHAAGCFTLPVVLPSILLIATASRMNNTMTKQFCQMNLF